MEDYYKILGLNKTNNVDEIKKAYRKLSMKYHPDRNKDIDASDKFTQINNAYNILSDNEKKSSYDIEYELYINSTMFTSLNNKDNDINNILYTKNTSSYISPNDMINLFKSQMNNNLNNNLNKNSNFNSNLNSNYYNNTLLSNSQSCEQLLDSLINNLFINTSNLNNNDNNTLTIEKELEIDIKKAYTGSNEPIKITRWIINSNIKVEETETLYITIDEGVDDNEIIIIKNKGNILHNNEGDIKVHIKIINNTNFERSGLDLIYKKNLTFKESLCGFLFDLDFIDGNNFQLCNKKGNIIVSNTTKIIPGMGMKRNNKIGNLIIKFIVENKSKLPINVVEMLEKVL